MENVVISGTGIFIPENNISTEELVNSYNLYADKASLNSTNPIPKSDANFIINVSGIKNRRVINKSGILNPDIMRPVYSPRADDKLSLQAEIAVHAAQDALLQANKKATDIDAIIVACSNLQRPYPALAIEVQAALGAKGFAFDMNAACSSAIFAINLARDMIIGGSAKSVLVITPEIYTAHLNFKDRKTHFIFGDGCSAVVIEAKRYCNSLNLYQILSTKLQTKFSNNIRNNFGFLNRCENTDLNSADKLFRQNGKKVREEVAQLTINHILEHLTAASISPQEIKRLWLHQANSHMSHAIATAVLGRTPQPEEFPSILSEYGNLGGAGMLVAFHQYHKDLATGTLGVLCSFGAGYTLGSAIIKKLKP